MEITGLPEKDIMPVTYSPKETVNDKGEKPEEKATAKTKPINILDEPEKENAPLDIMEEEKLNSELDRINKVVDLYNEELRFTLHKTSGRMMVEIVNRDTQEVVREIPPRKFLDWVVSFHNFLGAMIDTKI